MSSLGEIHVVSSRINNWHDATHQWLDKHNFSSNIKSVHLRDASEKSVYFKRRIVAELEADYLFDDSVDVAMGLDDIVNTIYLIKQPWNENINLESQDKIEPRKNLLHAAKSLSKKLTNRH